MRYKYQYDDSYYNVVNNFPQFTDVEEEEAFVRALNRGDSYCLHYRCFQ